MAYSNPYGDPYNPSGPGAPPPAVPPTVPPTVPPATAPPPPASRPPLSDAEYLAEVRAAGKTKSEDYARFSDAELLAWRKYYDGGGKFKNIYGDVVDKPDERGPNTPANMNGTGDQGDYGQGYNNSTVGGGGGAPGGGAGGGGGGGAGGGAGGGGGAGRPGGAGTYGGAPGFGFVPPSWQEAMADPGYQFALREGNQRLQGSAAAGGVLRTSGTLKDLMGYGQEMATQQYGNVYGRQYALAKDRFAPQYGSWQTTYDAALRKYLQREEHIYGASTPPPPAPPSY